MSRNEKSYVMVTGADRGIGLGLVRHYVGQDRAVIATTCRETPGKGLSTLAAESHRMRVVQLNQASESSIDALGQSCRESELKMDLVINNAGISLGEPFGSWSAAHFSDHFMINTIGPALVIQAIRPFLNSGSKVVQVTSGMGSAELNLGAENPLDAYAASKCALNIVSRRLAEKLRDAGIAVITMSPGWVQTDMGGPDAPTPVDEAVSTMAATIARLDMSDTGTFISSDGSRCPW